MHLSASLDLDLVAHETDDTLSVLVELTAPAAPTDLTRVHRTLQVVLDRSGSMADGPLEGAKTALLALVDRLDPQDNFGLVTFDDTATIVVACGPLVDKAAVRHAIAAVHPGGSTDLAAGYLLGLQEVRRSATQGATLLLVSDGHANAGETDPARLGAVAAKAHADGTTTSTVGYGLGYDERLLSALARGGQGNEHFAEDPDAAGKLIAGEVTGLLTQAASAAALLVRMSPYVRGVRVINDLPCHGVDAGVLVELGALYAGESRKLVLTFDVPAIASLGLAEVATLELSYVDLPALVQHTVALPLHVNVVPGDHAAGRVPDPVVRTELAYQQAQREKRTASDRLSAGDVPGALRSLRRARAAIDQALTLAPPQARAELQEESTALGDLQREAEHGDTSRAAKYSSMDASRKSRTRGRRAS